MTRDPNITTLGNIKMYGSLSFLIANNHNDCKHRHYKDYKVWNSTIIADL